MKNSAAMIDLRDRILRFWFIGPGAPASVRLRDALLHDPLLNSGAWFKQSDDFDSAVRDEFGDAIGLAPSGAYNDWKRTPEGALALILLTDQFPRNAFRGTSRAFEFDAIALDTALKGLALRFDQSLHPIQRWFFYMPLEHSENLVCQARAVDLFARLADDAEPELHAALKGAFDYALRHRDVIERFGRFPHRNAILRRPSTAAETDFLTKPGSRF